MSLETASVFAYALPAFFMVYLAFKLDDRHKPLRIIFTSLSLILISGVPLIAADYAGGGTPEELVRVGIVPLIAGLIFYLFYLIYIIGIRDTIKGGFNENRSQFQEEF